MASAKIMVVEDEVSTARNILSSLKKYGYNVNGHVAYGKLAIKKAVDEKPDLVLMDIDLKGDMDGIEASQKIAGRMDIPIIFLASETDAKTLKKTKISLPYGYLIKPCDSNALNTTIETALSYHKENLKLKKSMEKYKDLYDNAPDGYILLDKFGEIIDINNTMTEMFSYPKESIIGRNITSFMNKKDADIFTEKFIDSQSIADSLSGSHIEFSVACNGNGSMPVIARTSPQLDDQGRVIRYRLLLKDINGLNSIAAGEKNTDKVRLKLKKALMLTDNEKKVFYGMMRFPSLNDTKLSELLRIKRSTVTAIKNKLNKGGFYRTFRIPNFAYLGCELMTVFHCEVNSVNKEISEKVKIFREIAESSEQVFLKTTNRELIGLCISKNITDFKLHMDQITRRYHKDNLLQGIKISYLPFAISTIKDASSSREMYKNMLDLEDDLIPLDIEKKARASRPKKRNGKSLTHKEKIILYALVKYPQMNDSEIAEKTKLPRTSVSQTRRKLASEGVLFDVNIPDPQKMKYELLVYTHIKYNPRLPVENIKEAVNILHKHESSFFMISSDTESCCLNIFKDYNEYEDFRNMNVKYFNENHLLKERIINRVLPFEQIKFFKLDFAPIVKKIFDLNVKF